jgi:hypothetical protein
MVSALAIAMSARIGMARRERSLGLAAPGAGMRVFAVGAAGVNGPGFRPCGGIHKPAAARRYTGAKWTLLPGIALRGRQSRRRRAAMGCGRAMAGGWGFMAWR